MPLRLIFLLLGLILAYLLREVLLVSFLAVVFGVVFSFPVRLFSRVMPRGLGVVLTLILLIAGAGAIVLVAVKPLSEQANELKDQIPVARQRASQWFHRVQRLSGDPSAKSPGSAPPAAQTDAKAPPAEALIQPTLKGAGQALFSVTSAISGLILMIILAAFFVHEPDSYREGLKSLIPYSDEGEFDELWKRLRIGLGHWLKGILISMTIMGVVTGAGLWIAHIPNWPLLAVLTFLGTFIPYVGAIASAVPGLIFGLADSTDKFIAAAIVYLGMHIVEGYLVQPLIMRRAVVIRPGVLLMWQLAMGALFGIMGVIIATPLLVCVKITVGYLYLEKRLGKKPSEI